MQNHEVAYPQRELSDMLVQFLQALDDTPSSFAELVETFCDSRPALADAFRKSVAELAETGLLEDEADGPVDYGAYTIEHQLGSGGMGVVYLARKAGEDHPVALKVIRPAELLLGGKARFAREAEAVAALNHPGVAKLVEAVLDGDHPALAFELVEGEALSAILRRSLLLPPEERVPSLLGGPSEVEDGRRAEAWARACAEVAVQVARALQHAHENGVLHRDLKPANVVLGPGGHATLLDFGLASLEGAHRLTRSGAQLGSLPYMAPEQLRGKRESIDERTDVYGLGVTLYELLTLQQPFLGRDVATTRERILAGRVVAPGEHLPGLPRPLELVCLKAMEMEPRDRYTSAEALAADLERALAGDEVRAKPPSVYRRLRRWTQTHPALAVAAASVLFLAFAAPSGVAWAARREAAQAREFGKRLGAALEAAKNERERALSSLELARTAIVDLVARIGAEELPKTPQLQIVQEEVLRMSRDLYRRLYAERPDDPDVLREYLDLVAKHAGALDALGRVEGSDQAFADLNDLVETVEASDGDVSLVRQVRSMSGFRRMLVEFNALNYEGVLAEWDRVEQDIEFLLERDPGSYLQRRRRADGSATAAMAALSLGRGDRALQWLDTAEADLDVLIDEAFDDAKRLIALTGAIETAAAAWSVVEDSERGARIAQRAVDVAERCFELDPMAPESRFSLANAQCMLAGYRAATGEGGAASARRLLEDAAEHARAIARDFPDVVRYAGTWSRVQMRLADVLSREGRHADAVTAVESVIESLSEGLAARPDDVKIRSQLLFTCMVAAQHATAAPEGSPDAEALLPRAIASCDHGLEMVDAATTEERAALATMACWLVQFRIVALARQLDAQAWPETVGLEARLPLSPVESGMMLMVYDSLLRLVDVGELAEGDVDGKSAEARIRNRVLHHLADWVTSPAAQVSDYRDFERLRRFNGPDVDRLLERIGQQGE